MPVVSVVLTVTAAAANAFDYDFYPPDASPQAMGLGDFQILTGLGSNLAPPSSSMVEGSVTEISEDNPQGFDPMPGELFDVYLYAGPGIKKYDSDDLLVTFGYEWDLPYALSSMRVYRADLDGAHPDPATLFSIDFTPADFYPVVTVQGRPAGGVPYEYTTCCGLRVPVGSNRVHMRTTHRPMQWPR